MSADSGKPDAGEWAERIWQGFCDDIGVSIKETIANGLADFQRETLAWLVSQYRADQPVYVAEWLERLAESCGRGK